MAFKIKGANLARRERAQGQIRAECRRIREWLAFRAGTEPVIPKKDDPILKSTAIMQAVAEFEDRVQRIAVEANQTRGDDRHREQEGDDAEEDLERRGVWTLLPEEELAIRGALQCWRLLARMEVTDYL